MQKFAPPRPHREKSRLNSFTLVELLVVMAIIGILVAITLQAASGVMQASARNRAAGEIQGMGTALESYKADNGVYPQVNTMFTNNATPTPWYTQCDGSGGTGIQTNYIYSSQVLYQALSGQTNFLDTPITGSKVYFAFKANMLGNSKAAAGTSGTSGNSTYVQDPWTYSYGYNTGNSTNYPYNGNGFFDLWSTGGLITTSANNAFTNTAAWKSNWQN